MRCRCGLLHASIMRYLDLKDDLKRIKNDKVLRQSPFDACQMILSGSRFDLNFNDRYNSFFIDRYNRFALGVITHTSCYEFTCRIEYSTTTHIRSTQC